MKTLPVHWDEASRAPQSPAARDICRGVGRLFKAYGFAPLSEVTLASGRRADVIGLSQAAEIWLVEIKSCLDDFRVDQKWPQYREFCDRFFFAVGPTFPREVLPADTGLIVADRYGGEILRPAPDHKLAAPRRRALTLRLARTAALRLQAVLDPDQDLDALPQS
ncbi:MAG TPA: MmcB family DNA repair protein [Hyphomicrobiaceae bacterium]|jgi:hypothetical protein|nr:MmcB family DNA repair protein [Hyphomicrobiaceae bacterium]